MAQQWQTVFLDTQSENEIEKLLLIFAKYKVSYELISYDSKSIEIKIHSHITNKVLYDTIKESGAKIKINEMRDVFKSPLHISRMRIIDNYDRETQLKMKDGIVKNYLETIQSFSDSINAFLDADMRTEHLISENKILKEWSNGLENFLIEWSNKYE